MIDLDTYKSIVERGLRSYHTNPLIAVTECVVEPIQEGENYASVIVRAKCKINQDGENYSKSLIVKTMPSGDFMTEYVVNQRCFEKEIKMLKEVMPRIAVLLKAAGIDGDVAPKFYYSEDNPRLIIMEDLCESKFKIKDMKEGLDLNTCIHVMQTLATFHAASHVLLSTMPELKEFFREGYWGSSNQKITHNMLVQQLDSLIKCIDTWSNEKWADRLQRFRKRMPDEFFALYDADETNVPLVLNHVDVKTNNMMFRYRGCGIFDVKLIDLQLCAARSPVFDLLYFIFSSPRNDIRFVEMDTMLRAYHRRWTLCCKLLGQSDAFTYEALKEDFKKKLVFGFGILYGLYPLVATDIQKDDQKVYEMNEQAFSSKEVQKTILNGLAYFEEQELFELLP